MPLGLGFFATAGASAGGGSYELIETQTLASTTASITFSAIPQDFKHVQIRLNAKTATAGANSQQLIMRFNDISTSTYYTHRLYGTGTSVTSTSIALNTGIYLTSVPGGEQATEYQGAMVIDILDYSSSVKLKTLRGIGGMSHTTQNWVELFSGFYTAETTAVSSITILPPSGNLAAGSRFSIYGIRGA